MFQLRGQLVSHSYDILNGVSAFSGSLGPVRLFVTKSLHLLSLVSSIGALSLSILTLAVILWRGGKRLSTCFWKRRQVHWLSKRTKLRSWKIQGRKSGSDGTEGGRVLLSVPIVRRRGAGTDGTAGRCASGRWIATGSIDIIDIWWRKTKVGIESHG